MFFRPDKSIQERLTKLETHLKNENPLLLETISCVKKLDRIAYRMGLLDCNETFATRISWWPIISVLGTFSSGKSSFINQFLNQKLQLTGSQAVDDRFTVISYSSNKESQVLPGLALDLDPRFPFYQMSNEIEQVAESEENSIDACLQMKTSDSEKISGKIIIDSPGFDADDQRNVTLQLTNHIIDSSDLVLVFFDARRPETGAMHDTLDQLVSNTISRNDPGKFLYILNQIDTAAHEDNSEEVIAAWQRALAQKGLTSGRFYTIYINEAAVPIVDSTVRERFERRCEADLSSIYERIHRLEVERSYRVVGSIKKITSDIEKKAVPALSAALKRWMELVFIFDVAAFSTVFILLSVLSEWVNLWGIFNIDFTDSPLVSTLKATVITSLYLFIHYSMRKYAAKWVAHKLIDRHATGSIRNAFFRNTKIFRSILQTSPIGWSFFSRRVLTSVTSAVSELIQTMNDRYTRPSGNKLRNSRDTDDFTVVDINKMKRSKSY